MEFWENYLEDIIKKLKYLMKKKKKIKIDLHIHTKYSTDGKMTLMEVIEEAKKRNYDIISITDHDNISAYDELEDYIKNGLLGDLIIIPGVEFTIDNKDYGAQCHILQYMFNPKNRKMLDLIKKSTNAYYNRTKIQFARINKNSALQYFIKKHNISLSIEDYYRFLDKYENNVPDYASLSEYLVQVFSKYNVGVLDIFKKLEEVNKKDECCARKKLKCDRFEVLRHKYKDIENANHSPRLLLSILGVRGDDDDYFSDYAPTGSISVNSYGQLKTEDLIQENMTVFAHPEESKLDIVKNIIMNNKFIVGIEDNKKSKNKSKRKLYKLMNDLNLFITKGTDAHNIQELSDDIIDNNMMNKIMKEILKYGNN